MISSDGALVVNTTSVIAMVISSLQFMVVVAMIAVIVSRAYKLGEARLLKTDKQNEEIASADEV